MTRREIINRVAGLGITRRRAKEAVDTFIKEIREALSRQEKVKISNFGIFYVKNKPARKGMNPKTKEKIQIQAKRYPVFRASPILCEQINKG